MGVCVQYIFENTNTQPQALSSLRLLLSGTVLVILNFLCQAFRLDLPYRRYRSCLLRIRYFSGYRPDQTGYRHT